MSRILAIIRRDFMHVRGNAIALLVCMGLIVIPSFYAWFNIAGGWDPYGNTSQVKVALANSDEGVRGSIIPFNVNVGERVVNSLAGSTKVGYVVTSENDAVDGVRAGKYYAAVVIPKNFSSNLLSVLTKNPAHPQLEYYVNEKRNAIASIVTGKVSGSVQNMIDEGFTEAVTEAATDLFAEVSLFADDDSALAMGASLGNVLDRTLESLRGSASNIQAYVGVVASLRSVTDSSSALFGNDSAALSASDALSQTADGVREFDGAVDLAKDGVSKAVDRGSSSVKDVEDAIEGAFDMADGEVDKLVGALQKANEIAVDRRDKLREFLDVLNDLNGQLVDLKQELDVGSVDIEVVYTLDNDISDLISRTSNAISYMDDLIATVEKSIDDIQTSKTDAQSAREEIDAMVTKARAAVDAARGSYQNNFSVSLDDVAGVIDDAASRADEISGSLAGKVEKVRSLIGDASTGLQNLENTLSDAATKLTDAADKLENVREKLSQAMSSGDVQLIRTIMGSDASSLVSFISAPVELDREPIFPVQNNGSAMTPYYTTMALWVGGTLMGVLMYVGLSKRALAETGARPRHAYFGRLAFFLAIGACQSTLLILGDLYFLGVQCVNPPLFFLTCWLASTVFINIIYSLATSFGDVGKAIAVFIMVLQVAGSGGTFPVEMLPKLFQLAYPFLPFVPSENAMRAAMFGVNGNDWLMEMGLLAAFIVPALLLGLLLSKPFVPVNEWIEEKMEQTKLM